MLAFLMALNISFVSGMYFVDASEVPELNA
jgi:hypothetical protein